MGAIFIDIKKVSNKQKRSEDGSDVTNPLSKKKVESKIVVQKETIRADKIKSVRSWQKTGEQECAVEGPMSIIYFEGDNSRSSTPDMLISESHESFAKRLKSTGVAEGQ